MKDVADIWDRDKDLMRGRLHVPLLRFKPEAISLNQIVTTPNRINEMD